MKKWALVFLALLTVLGLTVIEGATAACIDCHAPMVNGMAGGQHFALTCVTCHEGATAHDATPTDAALYPKVHFDQESCMDCHVDQYDTFEIVSGGKTFYGGSDGGPHPPKGWSKTSDLPYWNVLLDGHPFVLETYEDSPMAVNQIEHQETIRPGSVACLECHGTKVAYAMGIEYRDKDGTVHSIPAIKTTVTLPDGTVQDIPAKEYVLKEAHTIHTGTTQRDPGTGEWVEELVTTMIPAGTRLWTYTDGVNLSAEAYQQLYQVKTLITLPSPETVGGVTFTTIASYSGTGADIDAMGPNAGIAKRWIYAVFEALAFDGLDYYFDDPQGETHFTGGGTNWPSIASGELCNQCHDPHSGKLRIVRKALIAAIAERGINPYSPTGKNILTFEDASRQDQIIAVCAQCHSEYVGGHSAITGLDQDYFPWAKPADLENQYSSLFDYLQDWSHGGPVNPWQSTDDNARGFMPYGLTFPINAPLVKVSTLKPRYSSTAPCTRPAPPVPTATACASNARTAHSTQPIGSPRRSS